MSETADRELVDHLERQIESIIGDLGEDPADRAVFYTAMMRELQGLTRRLSRQRNDELYRFHASERDESISSLARKAGVSPQAFTRVLAIERARRS